MAKQDKIPGTYVSEKELESLGELLGTMRDYILSHEARIEILEGIFVKNVEDSIEATDRAEASDLAEFARLDEPTDDSA